VRSAFVARAAKIKEKTRLSEEKAKQFELALKLKEERDSAQTRVLSLEAQNKVVGGKLHMLPNRWR